MQGNSISTMDGTQTARNRNLWSTSNGFFNEERQQSAGNVSTISDHIATLRAYSGNGNGHGTRHAESVDGKHQSPAHYPTTQLIGVQSKFRRKYYHKVVLGALALLIVLLIIAVIVLSLNLKKSSTICRSKECLRTAASLVYAMDEETDPCEDFYQFVCGHWADEHPRPDASTSNDVFHELQTRVMRKLREFLKANSTDKEPEAVGKAKIMYKSCVDTDALDELKLAPLVEMFRKFELPLLPTALNWSLPSEAKYATAANESISKYNWLKSIVLMKQYLSVDMIIGFDVFADPLNCTVNRIAFGTPETDSALPFNNDDAHKLLRRIHRKTVFDHNNDDEDLDEKESDEEEAARDTADGLKAYTAYMRKVIETYLTYLYKDVVLSEVTEGIGEIVTNAVSVARHINRLHEEAENSTKPSKNVADDFVYISLMDLQQQSDKLIAPKTVPIWTEYLQMIMQDTYYAVPGRLRMSDLRIITSNADIVYLQSMVAYLEETPAAQIESYLWLSALEELILHTTSDMRLLHSEYMRQVIGTEGSMSRSLYCTHGTNSLMGMAVSYALADDDFTRHKLPRVQRMLSDIQRSFDRLVRNTAWMDAATKAKTMQKSAEMKSLIGFPQWLTNHTELNSHYAGVRVNLSTHLENMVGVLRWQMLNKLNDLETPDAFGWSLSPSTVNAFHTFQSNAITLPIAILQYPFYDLGLEVLNYGSIGTMLGHELTHGFDDSGRMFDRHGNMVQWWSNDTVNEYINRTECFIEQYSRYYLSDIDEYIDGELTLGENIADNGGMREAFYAYRLYVKDVGRERLKLPGLEHYTHEQLFFISFGSLWCETYTPVASRYALEDSHCPGKIRLRGVLSNSDEFARTFKCARGTGMNPIGPKCRIW